MYGSLRFIPGVVVTIIFRHEMHETSGLDFNPLTTEFYVQFVFLPEHPFVAFSVYCSDGWVVTDLCEGVHQ